MSRLGPSASTWILSACSRRCSRFHRPGRCARSYIRFGGRRAEGKGFGIAIVLRYILETCASAKDALKVLKRVPVHLPYNLAILDRSGDWRTVFISPDFPSVATSEVRMTFTRSNPPS